MVLSKAIDPEVLADAELIEEHLCRLRNPSSTLDLPFLKMSWRDLSRAAAFARRHDVGTVIAHLPPSHFFARLLFLAMLLRGRLVRLVQYHHSLEHKLNARDTVAKRVFFTRRNAIIHNSCDMDSPGDPGAAERLLAPARKRGSPYVMLVPGRLMWMKGHVLFLHALARVCQAVEIEPAQLQVFFVGEGAQRRAIEATIDELGLGQCVTLTGKVAHPVLLALYHMVDLVVVPSLDEGFGNVAIEALSRRALVLASDAGGLREILRHGENGFVFAAGDEDALVAELEVIWHDRHNALIDRDAARRDCVARFGLDAHVDRVVALLRG
jgi:glycosyltransferase involved in cell wall biosynthesis